MVAVGGQVEWTEGGDGRDARQHLCGGPSTGLCMPRRATSLPVGQVVEPSVGEAVCEGDRSDVVVLW